jgi:hypothetical protein
MQGNIERLELRSDGRQMLDNTSESTSMGGNKVMWAGMRPTLGS